MTDENIIVLKCIYTTTNDQCTSEITTYIIHPILFAIEFNGEHNKTVNDGTSKLFKKEETVSTKTKCKLTIPRVTQNLLAGLASPSLSGALVMLAATELENTPPIARKKKALADLIKGHQCVIHPTHKSHCSSGLGKTKSK